MSEKNKYIIKKMYYRHDKIDLDLILKDWDETFSIMEYTDFLDKNTSFYIIKHCREWKTTVFKLGIYRDVFNRLKTDLKLQLSNRLFGTGIKEWRQLYKPKSRVEIKDNGCIKINIERV